VPSLSTHRWIAYAPADVAALRSGIATELQVPLGQRDEDSGQSDVGRRPVCRLDEGNLFEQIGGASYAFHRIDQGVFVLDVQRAVITGGPKVVDEVGPKRRATGVPKSQRHVVPGARTGFGDGHGVQQTSRVATQSLMRMSLACTWKIASPSVRITVGMCAPIHIRCDGSRFAPTMSPPHELT
jgi:hypothetical protein